MKIIHLCVFALILTLHACAGLNKSFASENSSKKLKDIMSQYTESYKRLDPFNAPYFNVEEDLGKFGDYPKAEYFKRKKEIYQKALDELRDVSPDSLSKKDLRTYKIFKEDMEISLQSFRFPIEMLDFNQMGNRLLSYMDDSNESLTTFPFNSVKHYEDFIHRSEGFPAYVEAQIELLRTGIREKILLNCACAKAALNTYKEALEPQIEKNPFFRPIGFMPPSFSGEDRHRLSNEFRAMIRDRIIPGYMKFDQFYQKEYIPHCRSTFGLGSFPNGKEWYEYEILAHTNLSLTSEQVYQKGIQEVARIQSELEELQKELRFKGSFKKFLASIKNEKKYFFGSPQDMFRAFESVRDRINKKITNFFSLIPKSELKLVEASNPEDAAGTYSSPTENIPYGRFIVNTKNLRMVPIYEVTTLFLHESIPGHHFQLSLQFEMKDELSEYQRKLYGSAAFIEGWALYSEFLGKEMGMYEDPLQRLGNLNDEMLRAVRLVVDSGIHAYGWSREKATRYMTEHLATDAKDISNEVNRYSVWPAQALAYKIGQIKILELRRKAEKVLGPRFNLKDFHRVVIGSGSVSLGILEAQIQEWIEQVSKGGS